jgi:alpha-beta hydrolase superfamily lysophospholipase
VFPWVSAGLVVVELHRRRHRVLRRLVLRCLGLCALLGVGLVLVLILVLPAMTPRYAVLPAVVLLQLAVILPLLWLEANTSRWWSLPLVVLWLPVLMLSMAVHRLPATLTPEAAGIDWAGEPFLVQAADGVLLAGLVFPAEAPRGFVLLVHGVGAEKCQFLHSVAPLRERGFTVFTYDQRDHGESGGLTCTFGLLEAADLARVWALASRRVPGTRILYAISMGGAAAQIGAGKLDGLDALVLDSAYARFANVAGTRIPLVGAAVVAAMDALRVDVLLTGRRFLDVIPGDALRATHAFPVLIRHAADDPLVPSAEAHALARTTGPLARLSVYPGTRHAVGFADDPVGHRRALEELVARPR